jgi:YrbI family 3-deoxy-D-manno-octulosonate 8-phosphate phosphatase
MAAGRSSRKSLTTLRRRLARVRLVCLDVDGVLTDGGLHFGPDGGEWKRFDSRDGLGLAALVRAEYVVAFVSGRIAPCVAIRARALGVAADLQGVKDKAAAVEALRAKHGIAANEAVFVGDDLVDLPGFAAAGLGIAVADARPEVLAAADGILRAPGGYGAVRELAEALLRASGREDALPGLTVTRRRS